MSGRGFAERPHLSTPRLPLASRVNDWMLPERHSALPKSRRQKRLYHTCLAEFSTVVVAIARGNNFRQDAGRREQFR